MLKSLFTPDVQLLENVAEIVREFFSSRKTQENFKHLSGILGQSRECFGNILGIPQEISRKNSGILRNITKITRESSGYAWEFFVNTSRILRKCYGNTPEILRKCYGYTREYSGNTLEMLRGYSRILRKYYGCTREYSESTTRILLGFLGILQKYSRT